MSQCDLLLFGATRNTGLRLAEQACARGETVAAMARSGSDTSALKELGVRIIEGDAFEQADCERAMQETLPKRVISVLGGKNPEGRRVDAEGNLNVIRALENSSPVRCFLLMTSMGCGEQYENLNEKVKTFLGEALRAKTEAEEALKTTQLPWVIVRPGGLHNEPATGDFCLLDAPDRQRRSYLSRTDVATATLKVLDDDQWLYRVVTVQNNAMNEG